MEHQIDPSKEMAFTAAELLSWDFPPVPWVVEGLYPTGCNLLAGRAKIGKTFLALQIAIAVSNGSPILLHPGSEKRRVLYLALEGTNRDLQQRIRRLLNGSPPPPNLDIHRRWSKGEEGIELLDEYILAHPDTCLIVVDVLKNIKDERATGRNAYDADYEAARPLVEFCLRHSTSMLLLHHTRKAEGEDPFDLISGSMGLRAAIDTESLMVKTAAGHVCLHVRGREVSEKEHVIQQDGKTLGWEMVERAEIEEDSEIRRLILSAMTEISTLPCSPSDVEERLRYAGFAGDASGIRRAIIKMADDPASRVLRVSRGMYDLDNSDIPF